MSESRGHDLCPESGEFAAGCGFGCAVDLVGRANDVKTGNQVPYPKVRVVEQLKDYEADMARWSASEVPIRLLKANF